jgi:tRNA (adenine37-N6)-methyltransferase
MVDFRPIGVIRTPFVDIAGMPIQAAAAAGVRGTIELDPAFEPGLRDIEGFSHLILVYHFDRADARLSVTPFLDETPRGIFATRAPSRPNPIGMSTVRLLAVDGPRLEIEDVDMLDGTPLLDIKPYVPAIDDRAGARIGWYEGRLDALPEARSDRRFEAGE